MIIRLRFTILFLFVMLIANLLAGSLAGTLHARWLSALGVSYDALRSGETFRLVTGTFLSHDAGMFVRQFIFAGLVIGYTEIVRGTVLAASLFFVLDIFGTLVLMAVIGWGRPMVDLTAIGDVGMSIGGFGLIDVAVAGWRGRWILLITILLAITLKFYVAPDAVADVGHGLALILGFALGTVLPGHGPRVREEKRGAR